jgi:hypothetical protein
MRLLLNGGQGSINASACFIQEKKLIDLRYPDKDKGIWKGNYE